jgi:tetratricopeptide (TPR) repeat protein
MKRQIKVRNLVALFILFTSMLLLISCGPKARVPTSQLDTPEHHTYTGLRLLNQDKYADAQREFELAISLDPKYSKAYTGIALVKTYIGDYNAADDSLKMGWKYAKTDEEKIFVYVSRVRYYTQSKIEKKWLDLAKDEFDNAILTDAKHAPAYYFMGLAYKAALEFEKSRSMFGKVRNLNAEYLKESDTQWKIVDKIQRAIPGTQLGKKIAIVDSLSRADVAALFIQEMKLEELYETRRKVPEAKWTSPDKSQIKEADKIPVASDITMHPLRVDIEKVLKLGIPGMEVVGGEFKPDGIITKAEFAVMIVDVFSKITSDESLVNKNFGDRKSKFSDLRGDEYYYSAAVTLTMKNFMELKDPVKDMFGPMDSVSGADALLIIRKMIDTYKIY